MEIVFTEWVSVSDASSVGEARRAAISVANRLGFDETSEALALENRYGCLIARPELVERCVHLDRNPASRMPDDLDRAVRWLGHGASLLVFVPAKRFPALTSRPGYGYTPGNR